MHRLTTSTLRSSRRRPPIIQQASSRRRRSTTTTCTPHRSLVALCWWVVLLAREPARALQPEIVAPPPVLRNTYFAIRHGQSTANVANVISSDPIVGSTRHELTPLGKAQAVEAGAALWAELRQVVASSATPEHDVLENVALYSSNFTRARETKEIIAFELQRQRQRATGIFDGPPIRVGLLESLRERDFGLLDGQNTGAYDRVWPRDLRDPFDATDGVESVAAVCERLRAMVDALETRHDGDCLALCAHADVIQIFQCWMGRCDVRAFSSYRFKNGEVRRCDDKGECLPPPVPMVSQAGQAA